MRTRRLRAADGRLRPMIDWSTHTAILPARITKTANPRTVPLDPELYTILKEASEARSSDSSFVVPPSHVDRQSGSNRHTRLKRILAGLKIEPWEDLFQTLRRNAIQYLRGLLKDSWAVTRIAGNSEEVQEKYYLGGLRQEDTDKITGLRQDTRIAEIIAAWPLLPPRLQNRFINAARRWAKQPQTSTKCSAKSPEAKSVRS